MKRVLLISLLLLGLVWVWASAAGFSHNYLPVVYRQLTPIPTEVTPEPTTNPFPPGVQYLPQGNLYESGGLLNYIGEVLNNTTQSLNSVYPAITFYSSTGNKIDTYDALMGPLNLPSRAKGCFIMRNMDIPSEWQTYEMEPITYTLGTSSQDLIILESSGSYDSSSGSYAITGQVRNDGNQLAYNVGVGGTLYNAADQPVGCEYNFVDSININSGEGSYFSIDFPGANRDYFDVDHYSLRVAGDHP